MPNETVKTSIDVIVPPTIAFNAWLNKELLHKWLFSEMDSEVIDVKMSAKVGGRFLIVQQPVGQTTHSEIIGTYLIINPPHELQFELCANEYFVGKTHVKVEFNATPEGCRISLFQQGTAGLTAQHWHKMLDQLRMSLEVQ